MLKSAQILHKWGLGDSQSNSTVASGASLNLQKKCLSCFAGLKPVYNGVCLQMANFTHYLLHYRKVGHKKTYLGLYEAKRRSPTHK